MTTTQPLYLVSACLVGLCTRYDNNVVASDVCKKRLEKSIWLPVCPEQLGGLPTPRPAADIVGGDGYDVLRGDAKVLSKDGQDFTREFIAGAHQMLQIAQAQPVEKVFLKARSPSCSVSGTRGVAASLLAQHGFVLEEF